MEDISKLREIMNEPIKNIHDDFDQFRKDMSDGFNQLHKDMDQFKKDIIKAIDRSSLLINATVVGMGVIQILFMYLLS